MGKFEKLVANEKKYCFGTYAPHSICPVKGEGATLTDTEGRVYVDFLGGIAVNSLGCNNPVWVKAVRRQITKLATASNYFYNEHRGALAKELVFGNLTKTFFSNSGAEANECAINLARKYFRDKVENRYNVVSLLDSFHGRTLAAVSVTGQPKYNLAYAPLPDGLHEYILLNDIAALEKALSDKEVCAFICEPILGESGVLPLSLEYLARARELCNANGVLLIFDEVQTGAGRTGTFWHSETLGIEPDIATGAKGLAGGIPIGVTLAKPEIAASFGVGDHGTTFGGNALASAAALATVKEIKKNYLKSNLEKGELLKTGLEKLPCVKEVRGAGLMLGAELDPSVSSKAVVSEMLKRGYILNAMARNTLRFVPPYVITAEQIEGMLTELEKAILSLCQ